MCSRMNHKSRQATIMLSAINHVPLKTICLKALCLYVGKQIPEEEQLQNIALMQICERTRKSSERKANGQH